MRKGSLRTYATQKCSIVCIFVNLESSGEEILCFCVFRRQTEFWMRPQRTMWLFSWLEIHLGELLSHNRLVSFVLISLTCKVDAVLNSLR